MVNGDAQEARYYLGAAAALVYTVACSVRVAEDLLSRSGDEGIIQRARELSRKVNEWHAELVSLQNRIL